MKYKINYSDIKGGSTSLEIQESINLKSLDSFLKYQLLATDHLESTGYEKQILEGIRDGTCTNLIQNECLEDKYIEDVNKRNLKFLELINEFKNNYLQSLDDPLDLAEEYFYVYRFICLNPEHFDKKILYPTIFSSSWNLDFVVDWADGRVGFIQKIKVGRNINFITTSYPNNEDIIDEDGNKFIIIEESLKKLFLDKNNFNKYIIGKDNKPRIKIINQTEYEVILPPGVTNYLGTYETFDQITIYNYEFTETPIDLIKQRVKISCQKGTIFDNDEVIQLDHPITSP